MQSVQVVGTRWPIAVRESTRPRYINRCCAPNCVAEVVTFDKEGKIVIISSRRIPKGEELRYDYEFNFEDDRDKIPCHCGAWNFI